MIKWWQNNGYEITIFTVGMAVGAIITNVVVTLTLFYLRYQ